MLGKRQHTRRRPHDGLVMDAQYVLMKIQVSVGLRSHTQNGAATLSTRHISNGVTMPMLDRQAVFHFGYLVKYRAALYCRSRPSTRRTFA